MATPLLPVLITVETTDVMFAVRLHTSDLPVHGWLRQIRDSLPPSSASAFSTRRRPLQMLLWPVQ
jgi:hypothetical protein